MWKHPPATGGTDTLPGRSQIPSSASLRDGLGALQGWGHLVPAQTWQQAAKQQPLSLCDIPNPWQEGSGSYETDHLATA